jgi:hypothetical protein
VRFGTDTEILSPPGFDASTFECIVVYIKIISTFILYDKYIKIVRLAEENFRKFRS